MFQATYAVMGRNCITLRSFLALILVCLFVFGEKYHGSDGKVHQKDFGRPLRTEDERQTDGRFDQSTRLKTTRPSRRFSRPHTLLIPTKSPAIKLTQRMDKEVGEELAELQHSTSEFQSVLGEAERYEPIRVSVEDNFRLAGGSEDSEPEKMSQSDMPSLHVVPTEPLCTEFHRPTNASNDIDTAHSNKTRQIKHKLRNTRPSVSSALPSRLRCLLNSVSDLSQQNSTLCNICNITTCVEYVRPYLTYLHQLASDAYDAQSEKQSMIKVKVNKEPRKSSGTRKGKKWSIPKIALRKMSIAATNIIDAAKSTAVPTLDIEHKSTTQDNINVTHPSHQQSMLEQNITYLNNIVAGKDATVRELVKRLSLLEQELSALRHTPPTTTQTLVQPVASKVEATVVESEVSVTSGDGDLIKQNPTVMGEETNKDQSPVGDIATTVSASFADGAAETGDLTNLIDTYELLQHVLNALYIVGASADSIANDNLSEITESALQNDEEVATDQSTDTETAVVSLVPAVIDRVRVSYPSIVDNVIAERQILEQYMQRVCDAAAVLAVALPYSVETATISLQDESTDEAADPTHIEVVVRNTDTISSATDTNDNIAQPNPLQAVVETLESQVDALNKELLHISAQLCHYRGQYFSPDAMEEHLPNKSAKKLWFW